MYSRRLLKKTPSSPASRSVPAAGTVALRRRPTPLDLGV